MYGNDSIDHGSKEADRLVKVGYDFSLNSPMVHEIIDWFEDKFSIYIQREIDTNINETLDVRYILKSWRFEPIEIMFDNAFDCFNRCRANFVCLKKMLDIVEEI